MAEILPETFKTWGDPLWLQTEGFFSTKNEAVLHFQGQTLLDKLFQKKKWQSWLINLSKYGTSTNLGWWNLKWYISIVEQSPALSDILYIYINQIFNYIYIFSIIPKCLLNPMLFKTTRCISRIKFTEHHRGCGLHPWSLTFRDPETMALEDYNTPVLTRDPFVFQLQGSI